MVLAIKNFHLASNFFLKSAKQLTKYYLKPLMQCLLSKVKAWPRSPKLPSYRPSKWCLICWFINFLPIFCTSQIQPTTAVGWCTALLFRIKPFRKDTNLAKLAKIRQFSYLHTPEHSNQPIKESYVTRTRLKKFSPRPRGKSVIGIFLAINKYVSINDRNCKDESE